MQEVPLSVTPAHPIRNETFLQLTAPAQPCSVVTDGSGWF